MNNELNNNQFGEYTDSKNYSNNNQADDSTAYSYPGEKTKKKRSFGMIKLTASALAFGLIAGAAFQGYTAITQPVSQSSNENQQATISQITDDDDDTVVPVSTLTNGVVTDVSDVVANVMPSIVAINATVTATNYDFFGREFSEEAQGSGSGIIIGQSESNLFIVTNNHVVEGATLVEIVFVDGKKATASIKGTDANADLAIVTVNMDTLDADTAAEIKVAILGNSDDVKAGEMAIAIGNALGYGQSVTVGYISAVNREVTISDQTMTLLQTDAAINPGNSGGALLNSNGQVIGINSVKYASEEVEGMGYSIPITSAIPLINELMTREVVAKEDQGFLGIDASTAQEVTQVYADRFHMPIGIYVNDVVANSPASKVGLKQGDIITGLDGNKIETIDDLVNTLSYKKAGQKVKLIIQVKENGEYVEKTLEITLGDKN